MSDGRDDVTDRVASRFDHDDDQEAEVDDSNEGETQSGGSKSTTNVKESWTAKSIYLSDDLDAALTREYKRLDFELDDDLATLRKTRHFYPLVVEAGLEALEEMKREELIERIERIDPD